VPRTNSTAGGRHPYFKVARMHAVQPVGATSQPPVVTWQQLDSFLEASQATLRRCDDPEAPAPPGLELALLREGADAACASLCCSVAGMMQRMSPGAASTLMATVAGMRLRRILDPSQPALASAVAGYVSAVAVALAAFVTLTIMLAWMLNGMGLLVCLGADAAGHVLLLPHATTTTTPMCNPAEPASPLLSIFFSGVGIYITLQMAWLQGMRSVHIITKFDRLMPRAVALWFLATISYTGKDGCV
jgi:hypothetical protein